MMGSAPCPSDALTGCLPRADKPIRFVCAGIRVPKYILKLLTGGTLVVKKRFGYSANPDRCRRSAAGGFGADTF